MQLTGSDGNGAGAHNRARARPGAWTILLATLLATVAAPASGEPPRQATEEEMQLFRSHLRASFDDIHDVSMRFHAVDPGIDGTIALKMLWEDGRMVSGEVESNDTGNEEEPLALLDAIRRWRIEGLAGPCQMVVPFRIRIVGSKEPDFAEKGILTGRVLDSEGRPIASAVIAFTGMAADVPAPPAARTNREGIFVRTLIPPGRWDVTCSAEGFQAAERRGVSLAAGEHLVVDFTLSPASVPD